MSMTSGTKGVTAEINVTPLIDVVLVLLIIFMVITPMLQKGKPVQLPEGPQPAKKPDSSDDAIISLVHNGGPTQVLYYFKDGEQPMAKEMLARELAELNERAPSTPLYIKADKRLAYGEVKAAMLMTEAAGFREVSLVAEAAAKSN